MTVTGLSAAIHTQGRVAFVDNPRAVESEKAGIGSTSAAVLSVRNNNVFGQGLHYREVTPTLLSLGTNGTGSGTVRVRVWLNATLPGSGGASDEPRWTSVEAADSCVSYDVDAETRTGGRLIAAFQMAKTDSLLVDLKGSGLTLNTGEKLTVTASTSNGSASVSAGLTWQEA